MFELITLRAFELESIQHEQHKWVLVGPGIMIVNVVLTKPSCCLSVGWVVRRHHSIRHQAPGIKHQASGADKEALGLSKTCHAHSGLRGRSRQGMDRPPLDCTPPSTAAAAMNTCTYLPTHSPNRFVMTPSSPLQLLSPPRSLLITRRVLLL